MSSGVKNKKNRKPSAGFRDRESLERKKKVKFGLWTGVSDIINRNWNERSSILWSGERPLRKGGFEEDAIRRRRNENDGQKHGIREVPYSIRCGKDSKKSTGGKGRRRKSRKKIFWEVVTKGGAG